MFNTHYFKQNFLFFQYKIINIDKKIRWFPFSDRKKGLNKVDCLVSSEVLEVAKVYTPMGV